MITPISHINFTSLFAENTFLDLKIERLLLQAVHINSMLKFTRFAPWLRNTH